MLKSDSGGDENQTKTALTWKTKAVLQILDGKYAFNGDYEIFPCLCRSM